MEDEFRVDVLNFSILEELADVWTAKEFSELLGEMEFGSIDGLSPVEIREMCLLALQELEPEAAAALILKYRLGERLREGQIRNIATEMPDEKLWEEYADMSFHEQLFNASSLLYMAFPNIFPEPDAVKATVRITALHETGKEILQSALTESFLLRLLAGGMDQNATLHRLFEEQLAGDLFPEAEFIVWTFRTESNTDGTSNVEVIGSGAWLDPLRNTKSYAAHAAPDELPEIGKRHDRID